MKTSLVFLYRLFMIVLLAWIAYTQTLIYRGRPVPVRVDEPVKVEVDNEPLSVEVDNTPLDVQIER